MELKYIDIGLNLMGKQFDSDRETVAADSFAAGVGFIVTGTDLKSDRAAVDYLKKADLSMHGAPAGFTRTMPTDGTRIIRDSCWS